MNLLQLERPIPEVNPDIIFRIFGYGISNTTLLIVFIMIGLVFLFAFRKYKIIPSKFQALFEIFVEGVFDLVHQVTGNKKVAERVFYITATIFLYLIITNLIGMYVPGLTSITYNGISIFRTPTSDFNTTLGLAAGMILLTHLVSIKDFGFFGHVGKFLQFKEVYVGFRKSPAEGGMAMVGLFVGILDVVGEFAKIIALSLRLFGNLYAGEVLMTVIFGGLAFALPALWMGMSTLSGVVQAVVFGLLFTAYYSSSVKHPEESE